MFEIQIIPFIQHVWNTAKADAQSSAARNGSDFGQFNSHTFQVVGDLTGKGDPACTKEDGRPGNGESKFGPACTPEPDAVHIGVYGHGKN
jgi:hypothetical protein